MIRRILCGALIASLWTAGVVTAPGFASVFAGENGKFVGIAYGHGGDNVFSQDLDGSHHTQITTTKDPNYYETPDWSPDGGRIATDLVPQTGDRKLYVMRSDGTDRVNLGPGAHPSWSPDGTELVYSHPGGPGVGGLFTINADGTNDTRLTDQYLDDMPTWSPGGDLIAYIGTVSPGVGGLVVVAPDGTGKTAIFTDSVVGDRPSWSPDGTEIVFGSVKDGNYEIYSVHPDGTGLTRLTNNGAIDGGAMWSPDGTKIAFSSDRSGKWKTYLMNPDGSGVTVLPGVAFPSDWQAIQVDLATSSKAITYGHSVDVTAHIVWYQTTSNETESIYETPFGGTTKLLLTGVADGSGDLSVTVKPSKDTTFSATWSGDADHPAGGMSDVVPVGVRPVVNSKMTKSYARAGKYHLYHFTTRCPLAGRGCPVFDTKVIPNHAKKCIEFLVEQQPAARWKVIEDTDCSQFSLNAKSAASVVFLYGSPKVIGIRFRIRSLFPHDADHLSAQSPWEYFKITK